MHIERERIDYVIRVSPLWQVRQFLLFRDMEQPDLWLGTDGHGRWGELNGAHRPELDGALDVTIAGSPFVHPIPIRRLPLGVGDEAELIVLAIDAETLGVERRSRKYVRLEERRWRVDDRTSTIEFDVDDYGIPTDIGDELPQGRSSHARRHALRERRQQLTHRRAHVRIAEGERDRGLEEADRVTGVVRATRESTPWNGARWPAPAARR